MISVFPSFSFRTARWLVSVLVLLSPWLPAAVFEDDFEGDAVGSTAGWDVGDGAPVVDEATFALFGSPNHLLDLRDPARKLLTGIAGFAAGEVTTFSCDFAELPGGAQTSGLQFGYAEATEINTAGAAARVQLLDGTVNHVNLGGLSSLTQTGDLSYAGNQPHRIYLVVNDRADPLIDYAGDEDLAPHSFEVWLRSGPTLQHVLEATIGRELKYAGLRTWSGFDSAFFVDRVRIDLGVNLAPGEQGCGLEVSHPGVAAGGTCTLYWAATALPAGTTYEITSDGDVTFSNGAAGGDASAGSGRVDATLHAAGAGEVAFTIEFRDPAGAAGLRQPAHGGGRRFLGPARAAASGCHEQRRAVGVHAGAGPEPPGLAGEGGLGRDAGDALRGPRLRPQPAGDGERGAERGECQRGRLPQRQPGGAVPRPAMGRDRRSGPPRQGPRDRERLGADLSRDGVDRELGADPAGERVGAAGVARGGRHPPLPRRGRGGLGPHRDGVVPLVHARALQPRPAGDVAAEQLGRLGLAGGHGLRGVERRSGDLRVRARQPTGPARLDQRDATARSPRPAGTAGIRSTRW